MAFQVSPNVLIQERDVSLFVPQIATTAGAFVGSFNWGPAEQFVTVDSEKALVSVFGSPDDNNFKYWYTAANFLAYGNNLQVNRIVGTTAANAAAATSTGVQVKNDDHYIGALGYTAPTLTGTEFIARYPGVRGNSLKVSVCDYNSYSFNVTISSITTTGATVAALTRPVAKGSFVEANISGVVYRFQSTADAASGATTIAFQNDTGASTSVANTATVLWEFWQNLTNRPSNTRAALAKASASSNATIYDELAIVVVDEDGLITGAPNTVIEVHEGLSKGTDAFNAAGQLAYYKEYINNNSAWVRWGSHTTLFTSSAAQSLAWGSALPGQGGAGFNSLSQVATRSFSGGLDGTPTDGLMQIEYAKLTNAELFDVSLIPVVGVVGDNATARYVTQNVAEVRRDCVVFVSPTSASLITAAGVVLDRITNFNIDSTYAFMDSGWKYQYDRYNDVYRYVPLCGDIAGLCVRTDLTTDPWYSPGGYSRGQVKNLVKLNWTPNKTDRDNLYRFQVNPVLTQPGLGTLLFGDKTTTQKPSAFDRINVRRLFIVLEKAIATAAKYQLFEFNDAFTRSQFNALVEPFLRDVQGRRGIYEFKVVCDETNNTGEVVDRNEFIADIYIKPAKSINYITLSFVATRTGVAFSEVGA
jgi:hypothetical protein